MDDRMKYAIMAVEAGAPVRRVAEVFGLAASTLYDAIRREGVPTPSFRTGSQWHGRPQPAPVRNSLAGLLGL